MKNCIIVCIPLINNSKNIYNPIRNPNPTKKGMDGLHPNKN